MDLPVFHPEWLVTFWLTTPGLNRLNPHIVLLLAAVCFIGIYLYRKKRILSAEADREEDRFQQLVKKRNLLERDLRELERARDHKEIANNRYLKKREELEMRLEMTKHELRQFTL